MKHLILNLLLIALVALGCRNGEKETGAADTGMSEKESTTTVTATFAGGGPIP